MFWQAWRMSKQLLTDALWAEIAPLIPPDPERPRGGRPPIAARDALMGILFILYTATAWELLPFEVAHCSGMTCWRRLRDWQAAGVWDALHRRILEKLNLAGEIDWSRSSVDASSVPAKKGAMRPARTRPIVANPAVSATSWSTATVCRSPLS
jgi:transposase